MMGVCCNIGFVVLIEVLCFMCNLICIDFGFVLGLWINVGGCVGCVDFGVCLFIICDFEEVCVIVVEFDWLNEECCVIEIVV